MRDKIRFDILVGFHGSGKSTWAKEQADKHGCVVVNRDALRTMLTGGTYRYDRRTEGHIKSIAMFSVRQFLMAGHPVVVDETNITASQRLEWLNLAKDPSYGLISLEVVPRFVWCIQSDPQVLLRRRMHDDRGQSADIWCGVIQKMIDAFEEPTTEEGAELYAIAT